MVLCMSNKFNRRSKYVKYSLKINSLTPKNRDQRKCLLENLLVNDCLQ